MDFEPGQTYQVYLSYYVGKDKDSSSNLIKRFYGDDGEKVSGSGSSQINEPLFQKMLINNVAGLKAADAPGPVYTVKASANKNLV